MKTLCLVLLTLVPCILAQGRFWGGGLPNPDFPEYNAQDSHLHVERRLAGGPCSATRVVIPVRSYADIAQRLRYPGSTTVYLQFLNSIILPSGIVLGPEYSCTVLTNAPRTRITLTYSKSDQPMLTVYNTSNILIANINWKYGINKNSKPCVYNLYKAGRETSKITCPGIYVVNSYGVQLVKGYIFGRIDVFRSIFVKLDSLKATMPPNSYAAGVKYDSYSTHGVIRMGETAVGTSLLRSHNVISNCEIYGHWELISLYRGAVGVTVRNNYLHDFLFSGIRCGADLAYVFDCHLNVIANNYITNPPAYTSSISDINNAGLYTAIHWFNPGNYLTCNYVTNQRHCIYLDFASSGVHIDGGMCHGGYDNVKVNNGKYNLVRSLVVVDSPKYLSFVSCVTLLFVQCKLPLANNWEAVRRAYWDTPALNKLYPWMRTLCNPAPPTSYRGVSCNPPGGLPASKTGGCSGLGYGNDVEIFAFNPPPVKGSIYTPQTALGCEQAPAVINVNRQVWWNVTSAPYARTFLNPAKLDFGVTRASPIYRIRPAFKNCPRSVTGQKYVFPYTYALDFNIPEPAHFQAVVNFDFAKIFSPKLQY